MDHEAWDPRTTRPSSVEICFDTVFGDVGDSLLVQVQGATAKRRDADAHILRGIAESAATELLHIQARQEAGPAQAFQAQQSNASLLQNPAHRITRRPRPTRALLFTILIGGRKHQKPPARHEGALLPITCFSAIEVFPFVASLTTLRSALRTAEAASPCI